MTDTHTHLYMDAFAGEECAVVERALAAGVGRMLFPGVCPESHEAMMALHRKFPDCTKVSLGLHPTEVGDDWSEVLDGMESLLEEGGFAAIGEIGIDRHWDSSRIDAQKEAFARQLEWACRYSLPVVIHCREGVEETLEVLGRFEDRLPTLVFHSFTSGTEDVRRIREICDPYFGINGVVTFKNAAPLREALPEIGIDRMVLETDAPYLAPVPHRGTRNESAYIPLIRDCVAATLGMPADEVERITDANASKIFGE
ncbi:MAG: TatD family hydrolase [Muribaculaceae bacterium]|nr:TatD family hydrolase [Muribaculaceae bacterium]